MTEKTSEETEEERSKQKVIILGAGGVGFWLTVSLMRDRGLDPNLEVEIWDNDNLVGGTGLARMPAFNTPETYKCDLLRGFIRVSMGDKSPAVKRERISKEIIENSLIGIDPPGSETFVVDCTDASLAERREWWDSLRSRGIRVMRVSYDGNGIVAVAKGLPFLQGGRQQGYDLVPTLAQSFAAGGLGAMALEKWLDGEDWEEFQIKV
ncbi:MAG: hypothetical protein L0Y56_11655 [Nitrospira sp.]|nr:hypothetical protein [Nitrospira sp.]